MAKRECDKETIINELVDVVYDAILEIGDGGEASISQLIGVWYEAQGYEFMHIDMTHGYVWTKDGGKTYSIEDFDQFEVLNRVTEKLKGQYKLDFSRLDDMPMGLPYNLEFVIRKKRRKNTVSC